MPYASNEELPASVRHVLPEHAQDIYRATFNSALEEHGGADEARLFRIAWGAVKREYAKVGGEWVRKDAADL